MKTIKNVEYEDAERELYKQLLAESIALRIELRYRYFENEKMPTYNQFYDNSFDILRLSKEEKEDIYKKVDRYLIKERRLLMANDSKNKPIYLVDAGKGVKKSNVC